MKDRDSSIRLQESSGEELNEIWKMEESEDAFCTVPNVESRAYLAVG
jgi:hypothetical protein